MNNKNIKSIRYRGKKNTFHCLSYKNNLLSREKINPTIQTNTFRQAVKENKPENQIYEKKKQKQRQKKFFWIELRKETEAKDKLI